MVRNIKPVNVVVLLMSCGFVWSAWIKAAELPVRKKPGYEWRQKDSSLALLNRGKVVWRLNFDKKEGKPYFHPVSLADGTVLTWLRPADHPWHRALWFSWKFINGVNYWEEDPKTGLSEGRTEVVDIKVTPHDDYSARVKMALNYHPLGKDAVLTEKRLIAVSAPDGDGKYHIDWDSRFTAGEKDVLLDRTPILGEEGGKGWGGYAGLSVRMAKATRGWQFVDSGGQRDEHAHGNKARWLDFSGDTAGGGSAGIAIFDRPENLRYPSPWYVAKGMPYFSPAVLFNKPYRLAAGKSLTLRYRILIHPGRADRGMLRNEWNTFLKTSDIEVRIESAEKLRQLALAALMYANDHKGKFDADLNKLKPYLGKENLFEWIVEDVEYVGQGEMWGVRRPHTRAVAYDKTLLGKGYGTNVAFMDGHVEFLRPKQLEKYGIRRLEEKKTAIKVDLLVCEVNECMEIDWETAEEIKNLVGEEKVFSPLAVLKSAVQRKQVARNKLANLVDLLSSKGYLKILMNPTLEVVDGGTAKIRSSQRGVDGKEITDSFEITPRILDDGYMNVSVKMVFQNEQISDLRKRVRDGQSFVSGCARKTLSISSGVRKTLSRLFEPSTETIFIVTAAISKDD